MNEVADESVQLVVTSPPYWQLKDYGSERQIGFDDTYEAYINNLNLVWAQCHRVLAGGCRLCINIGDQFARSVYYGRYKVIPIRTEITRFCETMGFDYMGAIIWQKVTTCNTTGGATIMGSFPYPRNGIVKLDYEFILLFKKPGSAPKVGKKIKEQSRLTIDEWNRFFAGHWNIPGDKQDKHLAVFPEEIPCRLIRMFTFVGDTVLDPFLGSGTTSLAARNLGRNSVGYEINPDFVPVIREKVSRTSCPRASKASRLRIQGRACPELVEGMPSTRAGADARDTIEFATQDAAGVDLRRAMNSLPYVFKDPVHFDKKVDPRKLQFGSKICRASERS
jgi:DNA modification methylase